MRQLILMRGAMGAGKSTFIENNGLKPYALSPDELRLMHQTPVLQENGKTAITMSNDKYVWETLFHLLEKRMERGELTVVDATHSKTEDMRQYKKLADTYCYRVWVVDFTDVPIEVAKKQNAMRSEHKRVPESSIDKVYARFAGEKVPSGFTVIKPNQINEVLQLNPFDYSEWKKIHFFGDLHGCNTVLQRYLSENGGIKDDEFYVFVGDYIDRGIENKELLDFLFSIVDRNNVIFLEGNHEIHLWKWANNEVPFSKHFINHTQKQLESDIGLLEVPERQKYERDVDYLVRIAKLIPREEGETMEFYLERLADQHYRSAPLIGETMEQWKKRTKEVRMENLKRQKSLDEFKKKARMFYRKLRQMLYIKYGNKIILVNHAGISTIPMEMNKIASDQFIRGVGGYEVDIDLIFSENVQAANILPNLSLSYIADYIGDLETFDGFFQIHGHRNLGNLPIFASSNSFNLEGEIEFGGHLRVLQLSHEHGFVPIEVENTVFDVEDPRAEPHLVFDNILEELRSKQDLINEKKFGNISSFNFNQDVFRYGKWNAQTIKARGIFINTETTEIVARSYNKFFNVGEKSFTRLNALKRNLVFPLDVYVKENGFLGINGYDSQSDTLVVASKSMLSGEFQGYFKTLLDATISQEGQEELKRILKEENLSAVYEVVDMNNDPHIIDYPQSGIYLLDMVRRTPAYEKLPYNELLEYGSYLGVQTKQYVTTFYDWQSFYEWYLRIMDDMSIQSVEGFVLEDATGFMTKIKLPFYNFWKQMRGIKEILSSKAQNPTINTARLITAESIDVYNFMKRQSKEYLSSTPIHIVRADYYREKNGTIIQARATI